MKRMLSGQETQAFVQYSLTETAHKQEDGRKQFGTCLNYRSCFLVLSVVNRQGYYGKSSLL